MKWFVKKIIASNKEPDQKILTDKGKIYTFLNPVSYLLVKTSNNLFQNFDGIFADGSILSLFIRLYSIKGVKRRSFDMTSFAPIVMNYAEKNNKTICFIGASKIQNEEAMRKLKTLYPKLCIIGSRSGYFSDRQERENSLDDIVNINPDYLIIGMGTPLQENFLLDAKTQGYKGIGFTCGGFIHQVANHSINFYPKFFDKYNIRWIYRFFKEKHTRKRYIRTAATFPFQFVYDRFSGENPKSKNKLPRQKQTVYQQNTNILSYRSKGLKIKPIEIKKKHKI